MQTSLQKWQKTDKGKATQKKCYIRYMSTEKGKQKARESSFRYYYKNQEKHKAKGAIRYAVITNKIAHIDTLKCCSCDQQAHAYHHHLGYDTKHRLDVTPVCDKCHITLHKS